jgi:hypothetical protein
MTGRHRVVLLGTGVLAAVVGLGAYAMVPPEPGVTRENFRRIHRDMTAAEVEAVLGRERRATS